jgi:hypothetical protein
MKKLYTIIFIFLLTTSCIAGDLASTFEQASALAAAQRKDPAAEAYQKNDGMRYFQQKYVPVFQSCLATTQHRDMTAFVFIAAIAKDGRVLQVYADKETNIFACARKTLEQDKFPEPPVAPFYLRIEINPSNTEVDGAPANSSFNEAAALGDEQDKDPATQEYVERDLKPYYRHKYGPVFNSCLVSTDHPDKSPFSFIAVIGKDGRVGQVYVNHETNIFACVRQTLVKDEFPHPPVDPYYMHMSMSFGQ